MPHGSPSAGKYILGGLGKGKKYAAKRERLAAVRAANAKSVMHNAARNKSKHATPEEAAIEQLRIAKGVKAVMAVNAAARKAANAKGVATKKGGKGVVRGALTVMLMTAGSMLSAKLADAAAEQLRVEHEEFAVEEQRIGKAIEADEGAYRPRIQVPRAQQRKDNGIAKAVANQAAKDMEDAKAGEKAAAKAHQEQEFL